MFFVLVLDHTAFAINKPLLVSSYPEHQGAARSDAVDQNWVRATYDRDLSGNPFSHMELRDAANDLVDGYDTLCGPTSDTAGKRSICFVPEFLLPEGDYTAVVVARAAVPDGAEHTEILFAIDDTAPAAPVITDPTPGEVSKDQPQLVQGTAEADALVVVMEGDDILGHEEADELGTFSIGMPWGPEDAVSHTIRAFAWDDALNKSPDSASVTFFHDSAAMQPPVILTPAEGAFLNSTSVTVSGTAKPNTTVEIEELGVVLESTPADALGNWSVVHVFSAGTHSITATSYDGVSPDGPSAARTFTVDVTAPAAPFVTAPSDGAQVTTANVTVAGTAEALGTVRIREAGNLRASAPVDGAGGWSTTVGFTEGAHTISVTVLDRAGNESPATVVTFTVDTVVPAAPTITTPAEGAFLPASLVTVGGSAEAGATVTVLEGTVAIGTAVAGGGGAWSVSIAFADGAHRLTARATDAAGNTGPESGARTFTVDTDAPDTPVIIDPAEGSTLATSAVTIAGTGEPDSTVTVMEGLSTIGTARVGPAGTWSMRPTFANGPHSIVAIASDNAGNTSAPSAARTFTVSAPVDGVPPAAPVILEPDPGDVTTSQVTFSGTAEAGATVRVLEGSTEWGSTTSTAGGWTLTAFLPSGAHSVTATATDPAGNTSAPSAAVAFTVDGARPAVFFTTPNNNIFLPGDPLTIYGTAADDAGVAGIELEYRNALGQVALSTTADVCTGCPGPSVSWSDSPSLGPGPYTVRAHAVDHVGNRSPEAKITIYRL